VNCETDFVSRGDIFKELVDDLALQIAACPQVQYISIDDVPEEVVKKETELEMQREDLLTKPKQVQAKIVEGHVKKRLGELMLFEQPFIKNDKVTISEWLKQTIGTTGENMKVRRFARYNLGEGLEKKSQDFAA
jgi:elongation factor Ts